jgi:hypothetical protein
MYGARSAEECFSVVVCTGTSVLTQAVTSCFDGFGSTCLHGIGALAGPKHVQSVTLLHLSVFITMLAILDFAKHMFWVNQEQGINTKKEPRHQYLLNASL